MTTTKSSVFFFDDIEVREREFCIVRAGEMVPVEPRAFRVLLLLLRNPQKLISKEELLSTVWDDVVVTENSLARTILKLRQRLGDDVRSPRYIETVAKVGYRFLRDVEAREERLDTAEIPKGSAVEQRRQVGSHPNPRGRKILFAAVVAVLLLFAAVFGLRLFRGASSASSLNPPHLAVEQRLTANPSDVPVKAAAISGDGKYLAYADPTGLYLRQISTGETRPLTLPKDFVAQPWNWYPDGTHLLVVKVPGPSSDRKPSLYKLSILGGEPQELISDAWGGSVSPDGSRIAYLSPSKVGNVWIMDSDGANARRVVSGPEPNQRGAVEDAIFSVVWSPSGQHLAYIQAHFRNAPTPVEPINSLRIVDPDGAGATVVLEDSRLGEALWWGTEDRILFSYREDPADAQRNYGVYSLRLDRQTQKANGPPQPVTMAEGLIGSMSGTADGRRLVLWRTREPAQVFLSDYDAGTHQWSEPRRLILDANVNFAYAWTVDSKAVFFVSNRNNRWKLLKQAIDETSPEVLVEGRSISTHRLSADGTQVLYLSLSDPDDASSSAVVMSKPVAGGAPRVVLQGKGIDNFECAMAPSTLCLFSQIDGNDYIFRAFDLEHGPGRELLKLPNKSLSENGNWSLSSDGAKLAIFLDRHRIRFFSVATGAAYDVAVKDWLLNNGDWGANGQTLFMPSYSPAGVSVILEVDQTGKAKVVLQGKPNADFLWMIQSPDSRHATVGKLIPTDDNAWVVSDFLTPRIVAPESRWMRVSPRRWFSSLVRSGVQGNALIDRIPGGLSPIRKLLLSKHFSSTRFNNFQHLCSQNSSNDLLKPIEIH